MLILPNRRTDCAAQLGPFHSVGMGLRCRFTQRLGSHFHIETLHNIPMPSAKATPPIYRLKIMLIGIEPPIWRRIQVPATMLLCCLHDALQAVFGWTDSHLHNFEKDGKYWGVPEYEDLIDESNVQLAKLLNAEGESMVYVYDFGDDWRHEVVLEEVIP